MAEQIQIAADEFRIEAGDFSGAMRLYHEPCDETLINTKWVSLVTLARLAGDHVCPLEES
jgi:hypothetical protein